MSQPVDMNQFWTEFYREQARERAEQARERAEERKNNAVHNEMMLELVRQLRQPSQQPIEVEEIVKKELKKYINTKELDISTHPLAHERSMEDRFRKILPQLYDKILASDQDDPYFHRRFTSTTSGQPLFIPKRDIATFINKYSSFMTEYLWNVVLDDNWRTRLRRQWKINNPEQAIRLIFIDDEDAKVDEILSATSEAFIFNTKSVYQGSKRTTSRAINQSDIEDIEHDPNARIGPDSYYLLEVQDDVKSEEANIRGYKYFNSIVTTYYINFKVDLDPETNTELQGQHAFEQTLIRSVNNIVEYRHDMRPVMINVYVFYYHLINNQIMEHKVNVFKGRRPDDLFGLTVEPTLRQQLISQGSDPDTETSIFTLDYTRVETSIVKPIAGGAYQEVQLGELLDAIKAEKKVVKTLKVGKVRHYEGKYTDNSCFIRILQQAIRATTYTDNHPDVPKFKSYTALWKYLDNHLSLDTFKHKITLDQAGKMASYFDINMSIYDPEANLLFENHNHSIHKLNILYLDEHYSHIFDMFHLATAENKEIPKRDGLKKKPVKKYVDCYYDFETVYDTSLNSAKSIQPYSVSYEFDGKMNTITTANPANEDIVVKMMEDLIIRASSEYHRHINQALEDNPEYAEEGIIVIINLMMIAYNGMNFDHILLFKYLAMQGYHIPQPPYGNKIHQMTATINNMEFRRNNGNPDTKIRDRIYLRVKVWDPYAFLMKSLDAAAAAFKINMKKLAFDHAHIQQLYLEGKLPEWLAENSNTLKEYNEQDVRILKEITVRLRESFVTSSIKVDPIRYGTIAGMCYKLWSKILYKGALEWVEDDVKYEIGADILSIYPSPVEIAKYQEKYTSVDTSDIPDDIDLDLDFDDGDDIFGVLNGDDSDSGNPNTTLDDELDKELDDILAIKHRNKNEDMAKPVSERMIDHCIRSAIVGGRVEGIQGVHEDQKYVMVDVASEYPYVMMKESYPVGKETVLYSKRDVREAYVNPDIIGIYYCKIRQSSLNRHGGNGKPYHPILPHRSADGRLDWSIAGAQKVIVAWVPDVTIKQLIQYGAKVIFHSDKNANKARAITWNRSQPGALFREYVYKFGEMKRKQDELSKLGDKNYNPVLREMSKLMLNSLSGKMAERLHTKKTIYYSYKEQAGLNRKLNDLDKRDADYEPNIITDRMMSLTYENDNFRLTKPSQIGVFIYAYSRAYMYEQIMSRYQVYYSDTDSAVISEKDYARLKKQKLPKTNLSIVWDGKTDKLFGMLEAEAMGFHMQVVAPKSYILYKPRPAIRTSRDVNTRYTVIKKRFKGVADKSTWVEIADNGDEVRHKLTTPGVWMKLFLYLRDHDKIYIEDWGVVKDIKDNKFSYRKVNKVISV